MEDEAEESEYTKKSVNKIRRALKALKDMEAEKSPKKAKTSPAAARLKRFAEMLEDTTSGLAKTLNTLDNGWKIISDVGRNYNKIAQWCGLPNFPPALLKSKESPDFQN